MTSTSGLFGTTGEVPGGTSSPMEFTGVPTGDRGESEETALGLLKNKTGSAKIHSPDSESTDKYM